MRNALNWFEIPVADIDRATAFYQRLYGTELVRQSMCDGELAMLPYEGEGVGGCLFRHAELRPAANGTLVYLNAGEDLAPMLARVEPAGGQVALPKTLVSPEVGHMAHFVDSEGNRVGLHSPR